MFSKEEPVFIAGCEEYDKEKIKAILKEAIESLGKSGWFAGEDVVVKPNLVRKMDPAKGGTTHPAVMAAAVELLFSYGARSVTVAESPGGIYNEARLKATYEGCGIAQAARGAGALLNYDVGFGTEKAPNGKTSKLFDVIDPIRKAGVIVNLCKMKSHGMLTQSCAAKNFFGVVPGIEKFEMHARFPDSKEFASMLCDLNEMLHEGRKILSVCDGIVGMEGNGPTNGTPVRAGVLLVSANPFSIDLACSVIMGMEGLPELLAEGIARGFCHAKTDELRVIGRRPEEFIVKNFALPDSSKPGSVEKLLTFRGGKYAKYFEPRPVINEKTCRGCGECVRSCPQKTISLVEKKGKKVARIDKTHCIKCYCCQELCPFDSVKIKKKLIIQIAARI